MLYKMVVTKNSDFGYNMSNGKRFFINTDDINILNKLLNDIRKFIYKYNIIIGIEKCEPTKPLKNNTIYVHRIKDLNWKNYNSEEQKYEDLVIKSKIMNCIKNLDLDIKTIDYVIDNSYYTELKYDYDVKYNIKQKIEYDIKWIINKYGNIVEKISIYETFKGYHMKIKLKEKISFFDKKYVYEYSNQDYLRYRCLYTIYYMLNTVNSKYHDSILQFYEVLFNKKYCRNYTYTERKVYEYEIL